MKRISIIIPVLNEFNCLKQLLESLKAFEDLAEIVVVDGGSEDESLKLLSSFSVKAISSSKGRARQMNKGAFASDSDYLLFIHADSYIDLEFKAAIHDLLKKECALASFGLAFQPSNFFLRANALFSRINHSWFYFGDQGLWISRKLFSEVGGFNEEYILLEDQEFYSRATEKTRALKSSYTLKTSSRAYLKYGSMRLQFLYYRIWLLYKLGYSQKVLLRILENFKAKYKS